jgi:two-component system, sensor histidine kinase
LNLRSLFQLDEDRVLVEQVKLLLDDARTSVPATILISALLAWVLSNDTNTLSLWLWAAAVCANECASYVHAQRTLAAGVTPHNARPLVRSLIVRKAGEGISWGVLPWLTLDTASPAGSVLVISVMAGVNASAMSLLSPVFPVFVAFCTLEAVLMSVKLLQMQDPAYQTLAAAVLLYVAMLIAQSRVTNNFTRSVINLRFENQDLIERLRQETLKSQEAQAVAVSANLAKSKFLAAASHDLRQPIHSLGLFLEVLGRSGLSPVQRQMLDSAQSATSAAGGMLNTLLDFSRLEAGVIEPQFRSVSMQRLLSKMEDEFAQQANDKALVYRSRETGLLVETDPILLEMVARNLISNAIRYTRAGGVLVACRSRGGSVLLEVWDTGVGIPAEQHRAIFGEFHQLGNPERDRNKGLGLGLAIVERLIRELKLELSLRSEPGRGSVFRVKLPRATTTPLVDAESTAYRMRPQLNLRVLVVDDDQLIRDGMGRLLQDWGCDCIAVESIEQALIAARAGAPDVVICDYRLREDRTGAEVIIALRSHLGADLPAFLITGDTAVERLREAQASGVALLHKPFSPDLLYQALRAVQIKGP